MRTLIAVTLATWAAMGCTNETTTKATGLPFAVADSATIVRTNRRLTNIVLSDFANTCSIADERQHPSSQMFTFLLADLDADAPPSKPGAYQIYTLETFPTTGLAGECGINADDATCKTVSSGSCTSGTVTLTRVDSSGYAGQFDVVIDGKHVTGSFDSPSCPDVSETGFGTCQ